GALGGSVSSQLHQGGFFDPNSESAASARTLAAATGSLADRNVIALVHVGSISAPAAQAEVTRVAATMSADPDIKTVYDYFEAHDPSLVSADRSQTLVIGLFNKQADDDTVSAAAARLQGKFKNDQAVVLGGVGTTYAEVQS